MSLGLILLVLVFQTAAAGEDWGKPRKLASVSIPGLNESSGVAASRKHPGVYWTHNDSGGKAEIFAFDATGKQRARVVVKGATARDWEGLAVGPGPAKAESYLYIGEIGNVRSATHFTIYRVPEPALDSETTEAAELFRVRRPSNSTDAEALLVGPRRGDVYIVTKALKRGQKTEVLKVSAPLKPNSTARKIATLDIGDGPLLQWFSAGGITGGDISPDSGRVALCDYLTVYEAVLPPGAKHFDEIWKAKWERIETGYRKQGEAVTYRQDGNALILTSEGPTFDLIEVERRTSR